MIYDLDLTPNDIGEIIEIIRVRHIRLTEDAFAKEIGVSPKLLHDTENGKGGSGINILRKTSSRFKNITLSLTVEIK